MTSEQQVLDNKTLVSQVVGVFAKQIVEGAVATVFFPYYLRFFLRSEKGGMDNLFENECTVAIRPSPSVQYCAVLCGVGVACCAGMTTGVTNYQGKQA